MILYLSTNTRPDIMYAVSQVTRYSHSPKTLHRTEVTRIVRCLSGSKDQGVTYNQSKALCVDYFVDTNLQDHIEINHLRALQVQNDCTGYSISTGRCYIMCKSHLKITIVLSTS